MSQPYCCEVCWRNPTCGNDCGSCSGESTELEQLMSNESKPRNELDRAIDATKERTAKMTNEQLRDFWDRMVAALGSDPTKEELRQIIAEHEAKGEDTGEGT